MIQVRSILCPTDFSDFSRRALAHAVPLARWYEARLTVLYVTPVLPAVPGFAPFVSPLTLEPIPRERLIDDVRAFAESASSAGIAVDCVVREGGAVPHILEQARDAAADLIVMGTHGRGGFEKLVLGSVTEKVLRKAPCPVMTVSAAAVGAAPHEPPDLRTILCAVDFSQASGEALRYALSLAQRARARLTLLHVLEWPEKEIRQPRLIDFTEYRRFLERDARQQLAASVPAEARQWCDVREEVTAGKPWREILRLAGEDGADLIVMGVRGRGPVDLMLFGSSAHHVVREAACPVITVRGG